MIKETYSIGEIQDALFPIFKNSGVRKAVLFGSYAKGTANVRSDADLLVDSGLRGLAFFGLLEDVTAALNIPVDMIDITQIQEGSLIDQEIKRSGVQIYEQ